jgi:hypothetical protein
MSTDFRALCARMADELDHYRQLLTDNRREIHALATEARAELAKPEPVAPPMPVPGDAEGLAEVFWGRYDQTEPVPPDHAEICRWLSGQAHWGPHDPNIARVANLVQYALARYARAAIQPVPVSERPWEREGWCDAVGECWLETVTLFPDHAAWIKTWPALVEKFPQCYARALPANALPAPEATND